MSFSTSAIEQPLPIPIQSMVEKCDLTKCPVKGRLGNFCIQHFEPTLVNGNRAIQGTVYDHQGLHSNFLAGARGLQFIEPLVGTTVIVRTDEATRVRLFQAEQVYFHQALITDTNPILLDITEETLMIPMLDEHRDKFHTHDWMVEQFSGGYGGWQQAYQFLQQLGCGPLRALAVDIAIENVVQYGLTHEFQIVAIPDDISDDFLHEHPLNTIIKSNIADVKWQKLLQWVFPKLWTISAPCVSWSGAGGRAGFRSLDGQSLAHALMECKIHRPCYIGLEQVEGFTNHEDFSLFLALVKWAGYEFLSASVQDVVSMVPIRRRRWIAVCIRQDLDHASFQPQKWPLGTVKPMHFDVLQKLTKEEMAQFQPSSQAAKVYFDPLNLPPFIKNRDQQAVQSQRLPSLKEPLPTVMAAYSQQHLLNPQDLATRGLMGFFIRDQDSFRFMTPAEIAMCHGQGRPLILAKPDCLAFRTLGNMITPIHALSVLLEITQHAGLFVTDLTFHEVAKQFLATTYKASSITVLQDECAWYLGTEPQVIQLKARMADFMRRLQWEPHASNEWPKGYFYQPDNGLIAPSQVVAMPVERISDTLDILMTMEFQVALIPGEYGTYKAETTLTWDALQRFWNQPLGPQGHLDSFKASQPIESFLSDLKQLMIPLRDTNLLISQGPPTPLMIRDEEHLMFYDVHDIGHWSDHCSRCMLPDQLYSDAFGRLTPMETHIFGEVSATWTPPTAIPNLAELLPAILQVRFRAEILPDTDILAFHCQGIQASKQAFLRLWQSQQLQDWLASKGRQVNYVDIGEQEWRLLFRPALPRTSTPASTPSEELFIRVLQIIILSLKATPGMDCLFSYRDRQLARELLPPYMELRLIHALVCHVSQVGLRAMHMVKTHRPDLPITASLEQHATFDANPIPFQVFQLNTQMEEYPSVSDLEEADFLDEHDEACTTTEIDSPANIVDAPWELRELFQLASTTISDQIGKYHHVVLSGSSDNIQFCHRIWTDPAIQAFVATASIELELGRLENQLRIKLGWKALTEEQFAVFRTSLFHRLVVCTMTQMPQQGPHRIVLKHSDVNFAEVSLANDQTLEELEACLFAWFHWLSPNHEVNMGPRLVAFGRCWNPEITVGQLLAATPTAPTSIKIHVVGALHGGGPRPPSSKQDYQKMIEAGLASLFLEYELPLPQIPSQVTKLIQHEGNPKLQAILQESNPVQKFKAFEQSCSSAGCALPRQGPRASRIAGKYQKIKDNANQKQMVNPDPSLFKLKPGFFCNEDQSHATILTTFTTQASGVILARPEEADTWMKSTLTKPTDELGVYVLGPVHIHPSYESIQVDAPATDQSGRELILHGTLIHFSTKHLQTAAAALEEFQTADIQVASITVWKKDYEENLWARIIEAPVKTIQSLLSLDGLGGILGQPWGRTFQHEGHPVSPQAASSVQFHATFQVGARFTMLLRRSGFSKIYICPKTQQGVPDPRWRVVWLPASTNILELESQANSIAGAAGLVSAKKGIGLRVETTNFHKAFTTLRPESELPDLTETKWRFKLQPLPLGITADVLREWATKNFAWSIRPIRACGAKQWIIGADSIPDKILSFNGQALLLQQLPDRGSRVSSTITAGPRSFPSKEKSHSRTGVTEKENTFRIGDPHFDPWRNFRSSTPWEPSQKTNPPSEPRSVTGPIADRMEQQDMRIQAVEQALTQFKDSQASKLAVIEHQQATVTTTVQTHMQQTQQNFDQMQKDQVQMQQTLTDALVKQEQRMATSFAELKQIFMTTKGRKRAAKADHDGNSSNSEEMER